MLSVTVVYLLPLIIRHEIFGKELELELDSELECGKIEESEFKSKVWFTSSSAQS